MLGFDASALLGGYNAWASAYPVEPKPKLIDIVTPERKA
jgi:hypothetical protein